MKILEKPLTSKKMPKTNSLSAKVTAGISSVENKDYEFKNENEISNGATSKFLFLLSYRIKITESCNES